MISDRFMTDFKKLNPSQYGEALDMEDKVEKFRNSLLQHGSKNNRVYLMKVDPEDCPVVINHAAMQAAAHNYTKIFAKVPESCKPYFEEKTFIQEAKVPRLFNDLEDGYFFSKFMSVDRQHEQQKTTVKEVIETAQKKGPQGAKQRTLPEGLSWRVMNKNDVGEMARLYKQVFPTYPFPIDDPAYLSSTMDENLIYHGIFNGSELIALSSAEVDFNGGHVEMTDFATLPDYRGQGLATFLLDRMEEDVRSGGIQTAYTIARAYSFGMNITFAKHGYQYAGTLVNNTQISGQLESMNVWHKHL
jgi:putative beta-lysine N-acetyltransferase